MNVVFVISDYVLHNHVLTEYIAARPDDRVAVVKIPLVLKGKSRSETARRIVPQLSRRFALGKAIEFGALAAITLVPKLFPRGPTFRRLRHIASREKLPFLKVENVMSPEALAFVGAQQPDVIVTLFHQIVKRALIDIPRVGVVNVHPGILPGFRGIQPYFWELSEQAGRAGATLHLIEDESIDTGGVLASASYATAPGMSVQLNYYLTSSVAAALLPRCLERLVAGELQPARQPEGAGAYYKWPDSAAFDRLRAAGHGLLSWRQLFGILDGRHDGFRAEVERFGTEAAATLR